MSKKESFNLNHNFDKEPLETYSNGSIKDLPVVETVTDVQDVEKLSFPQLWKTFPKCVFCIIGNEFCERFSFYGMVTVLTFYLVNVLLLSQNDASSVYHAFAWFYTFTPILGSILADGFIGKYHTILWVSLFYASGSIILAVCATFKPGSSIHPYGDYAGLFIIGLGTGGIKPCVSPFGGDQFKKGQDQAIGMFFSMFYFTINIGAFISAIVSPLFRIYPCLGQDTCYPLAFGFPAVLMICSIIVFAAGTPLYKRLKPQGNILIEVFKVIGIALKNKIKSKEKLEHWLNYYLLTHDCKTDRLCNEHEICQRIKLIKDIRGVFRILIMFLPLPFFWAIFDLQGDRWVLQGATMNGKYGSFVVLPDQMGATNTILILLFIPLFQGVVYPLLSKVVRLTLLRKMAAGGFMAVAGCAICGLLQLKINTTLPAIPNENSAFFTVLNYSPCNVTVSSVNDSNLVFQVIQQSSSFQIVNSITNDDEVFEWSVESCSSNRSLVTKLSNRMSTYAVLTSDSVGWNYADLQKSLQGEGQFKISVNYFANNTNVFTENDTVQFAWCTSNVSFTVNDSKDCNSNNADKYAEFTSPISGGRYMVAKENKTLWLLSILGKKVLDLQFWFLYIKYADGFYHNTNISYDQEHQGGIYTLTVLNDLDNKFTKEVYQIASDNTVSIFWQLPQYAVMTAAEILFSVTGLEFSFTQAPASMKTVIMAIWLLTDSIGNIIIILVNLISFSNLAVLFFVFALMLFVVMIIFVLLAVFYYEYVDMKKVS